MKISAKEYCLSSFNRPLFNVLLPFLHSSSLSSNKRIIGLDDMINDYGDIQYRIVTRKEEESKAVILELHVAVTVTCWADVCSDVLLDIKHVFAGHKEVAMIYDTNSCKATSLSCILHEGHQFALLVTCSKDTVDSTDNYGYELAKKLSNLRHLIVASQLRRAMDNVLNSAIPAKSLEKDKGDFDLFPMTSSLGRANIVKSAERVTVEFDLHYTDESDRAIARIFMKEMAEACRNCEYKKECVPPNIKGEHLSNSAGTILFHFPLNLSREPDRRESVIEIVIMFPYSLQYQVKSTKTSLRQRIREKEKDFLSYLNVTGS